MTIPAIRCALTAQGNIEAATRSQVWNDYDRLVVDCRTGAVINSTVKEGTDLFRWLVRAARKHVAP